MKLTPTAILKYLDCPRSFKYQYIDRLRPQVQSSNLHFGSAVHQAITAWLTGAADDPAAHFAACWREITEKVSLDYNTQWTPESLEATGKALVEQFPAAWQEAGILPLLDEEGQPVIERRLEVRLGDFVLSGQPDLIGLNREGEVVVLDFKTASNPAPEGFAGVSDQLAAYQVLVEAHAAVLGIHRVDQVGFMELIKRKVPNGKSKNGKGPEVLPPALAPRQDAGEFVRKAVWVARNIEAGNFFPNPRMAWNSPCGLCDFKLLCYEGSYEGLIMPEIYD